MAFQQRAERAAAEALAIGPLHEHHVRIGIAFEQQRPTLPGREATALPRADGRGLVIPIALLNPDESRSAEPYLPSSPPTFQYPRNHSGRELMPSRLSTVIGCRYLACATGIGAVESPDATVVIDRDLPATFGVVALGAGPVRVQETLSAALHDDDHDSITFLRGTALDGRSGRHCHASCAGRVRCNSGRAVGWLSAANRNSG